MLALRAAFHVVKERATAAVWCEPNRWPNPIVNAWYWRSEDEQCVQLDNCQIAALWRHLDRKHNWAAAAAAAIVELQVKDVLNTVLNHAASTASAGGSGDWLEIEYRTSSADSPAQFKRFTYRGTIRPPFPPPVDSRTCLPAGCTRAYFKGRRDLDIRQQAASFLGVSFLRAGVKTADQIDGVLWDIWWHCGRPEIEELEIVLEVGAGGGGAAEKQISLFQLLMSTLSERVVEVATAPTLHRPLFGMAPFIDHGEIAKQQQQQQRLGGGASSNSDGANDN